jgi:hypothetical protein
VGHRAATLARKASRDWRRVRRSWRLSGNARLSYGSGLSAAGSTPTGERVPYRVIWDPAELLPAKLPLRVWILSSVAFVSAYLFLWSYVHIQADIRPCELTLKDPLFRWIPHDRRWFFVSHEVYEVFTVCAVGALLYRAIRGDHRPLVRFGAALSVQGLLRATTIMLLPLCRANLKPGDIAIDRIPTVDLGLFELPWRMWATNDLVFSGHVGEFLLLTWVTRDWPRPVRVLLIVFQLLQAYALIATRGHYTIDIILAVPCAFLANAVAVRVLLFLCGRERSSVFAASNIR